MSERQERLEELHTLLVEVDAAYHLSERRDQGYFEEQSDEKVWRILSLIENLQV